MQDKETLQLYYEPSEQFAPQRQATFRYGPNPNVPAGPRSTAVAELGMEAFPPRRANPHAPSGKNRGGDGMANFSPAVNVWTPGYDQFGRPCWQHKETLQLYYEPSEQFAVQPEMTWGSGPNPNVPAGPRFTPVAEPGMEVFPPRRANPHAPSGKNQGGDGMANFSPAVNVWTPGYDQFGRPCWQNRETLKLYYDPSGQSPACPPMTLGDPSKTTSTNEKDAASRSASPTSKTPPPLRVGRAKEAEQWSLKHNEQGVEVYVNSTTKKSQSQTPDCLKKYTAR